MIIGATALALYLQLHLDYHIALNSTFVIAFCTVRTMYVCTYHYHRILLLSLTG